MSAERIKHHFQFGLLSNLRHIHHRYSVPIADYYGVCGGGGSPLSLTNTGAITVNGFTPIIHQQFKIFGMPELASFSNLFID
jgi:hypothetical protein